MLSGDEFSLEDLVVISDSSLGVGGASAIEVGISELWTGSAPSSKPTLSGVAGLLPGRTGKSRIFALGVSVVGVSKSS